MNISDIIRPNQHFIIVAYTEDEKNEVLTRCVACCRPAEHQSMLLLDLTPKYTRRVVQD